MIGDVNRDRTSNDTSAPVAGLQVFRLPRKIRTMGLVFVPIYFLLAVTGVWLPFANLDGSFGDPLVPAIMGGGGFGTMTLLSAYLLLAYKRTRLIASHNEVRLITAFSDRTIIFANVTRARWQPFPPGGSVVLTTPSARTAFSFAHFENSWDLFAFFRHSIPQAVQENYDELEAALNTIRPPVLIGSATTLYLAIGGLVSVIACLVLGDVPWIGHVLLFPLVFCPSVALASSMDLFRRPGWVIFLACLVSWVSVTLLVIALMPTIRLVMR